MRSIKAFPFYLFLLLIAAIGVSSCKQCNKPQSAQVAVKDSISSPKLDALNEQIKKDSLNPFLYYKRAQIYEANNDYKTALTNMFCALSLDSLTAEFYLYSAELFKKTGDLQRGIVLMNKAISTDSMNIKYYIEAGELAFIDTTIKGNYQLAMDYLNAAIEKDPQNADIYFYKGSVYEEKGDTNRAISSFQTATELNPKFYTAYVQLGLLLSQKKDKNAEKYLDNAIKVSDKPEDALYAKANIYKQQALALQDANKNAQAIEKFQLAIDNFKKVIDLDYKNAEAYMGAAFSYYQMDSVQDAYKYYELATKIEPSYAGAYFSKGICAEDMGRTKEAIALYQTCLNIDPDFKRAEEHLKKLQQVQ